MPVQTPIPEDSRIKEATALFRKHGGIMRMAKAIQAGIHRRTLYAMRDEGVLEQMSRGLYRLADAPPLASPDLVAGGPARSARRDLPHLGACLS